MVGRDEDRGRVGISSLKKKWIGLVRTCTGDYLGIPGAIGLKKTILYNTCICIYVCVVTSKMYFNHLGKSNFSDQFEAST